MWHKDVFSYNSRVDHALLSVTYGHFVHYLNHVGVEFDQLLSGAILPALRTKPTVRWEIEANVVDSDSTTNPVVYVIKSSAKRVTRSFSSVTADVPLSVRSH
jgi:hypothetical protein